MKNYIITLLVIEFFTSVTASFCGKSGVPYSFEVLQSGAPVLGCAQPSCLVESIGEFGSTDDSEFLTDVNGQPDGFFREGDRAAKHYRHPDAPKIIANCTGSFNELSCPKKNQWVGGIEYIDHPRQPVILQCCTFPGLRFSQEVGSTTVNPGEAITGGEVIRNGRQISFDVIANVKKVVKEGKIGYEVTVRRMNCLPDPPETEVQFENEVPSEVYKILSSAINKDLGTTQKLEEKKLLLKQEKEQKSPESGNFELQTLNQPNENHVTSFSKTEIMSSSPLNTQTSFVLSTTTAFPTFPTHLTHTFPTFPTLPTHSFPGLPTHTFPPHSLLTFPTHTFPPHTFPPGFPTFAPFGVTSPPLSASASNGVNSLSEPSSSAVASQPFSQFSLSNGDSSSSLKQPAIAFAAPSATDDAAASRPLLLLPQSEAPNDAPFHEAQSQVSRQSESQKAPEQLQLPLIQGPSAAVSASLSPPSGVVGAGGAFNGGAVQEVASITNSPSTLPTMFPMLPTMMPTAPPVMGSILSQLTGNVHPIMLPGLGVVGYSNGPQK